METVSLRLEEKFLQLIERIMKRRGYMTKTEFIREAIRDKIRELEKEEMLRQVEKLAGSSKHKTTDEQLHKVREKLIKEYEKKFKSVLLVF